MTYDEGIMYLDIELDKEILRYKFVIIDIIRLNGHMAEGMWSIQVYLDGKLVIKDY